MFALSRLIAKRTKSRSSLKGNYAKLSLLPGQEAYSFLASSNSTPAVQAGASRTLMTSKTASTLSSTTPGQGLADASAEISFTGGGPSLDLMLVDSVASQVHKGACRSKQGTCQGRSSRSKVAAI